ncbi:hypothetical protein Hamer_G026959, partial [Homarus americanus]
MEVGVSYQHPGWSGIGER